MDDAHALCTVVVSASLAIASASTNLRPHADCRAAFDFDDDIASIIYSALEFAKSACLRQTTDEKLPPKPRQNPNIK
jgi:hypothetical protein